MAKTVRSFQMHVKPIGANNKGFDATITVEVDLAKLADGLGRRAVYSKGHRAVEAGGLVVVRATDIRMIEGQA